MPSYKKILLIEDEAFIAELYADILREEGFTITCAYDGEEGLTLAQTTPFDIILLDLMLPTKSGLDVLTTLRDTNQSPNFNQATPIIILTNFEEDDITKQKLRSMSQGYVLKVSMTPRTLAQALKDMEAGKPLPEQTSSPREENGPTVP